MACIRFTLWIGLIFYELQSFAHGLQIPVHQTSENVKSIKELQLDVNSRPESTNKLIVKRATDDALLTPQIFKFELDDAKEPDEATKKLIQQRARELQHREKDIEVVNITVSNRSKRAAQKVKPQLIPFLISDAKEPDSATKELIRRSRAKEISSLTTKEPTSRHGKNKETSVVTQKKEPPSQSRGKAFASTSVSKEIFGQGRVKSVALTTESREPLRKGKVQSVPLTASKEDSLRVSRVNEGSATSPKRRQRSNKKSPRKRTRRFAQLTEPRYIKFELHDVKEPGIDARSEVQILPRPVYGSKIPSHQVSDPNTSQYDSDSSAQSSKYRYFIHEAPRKPQFGMVYPKRYEHNDMVFRVSKMQKYIASGQGLENINTNIEITIPPSVTATAILSGYPNQVYGQKICAYGNRGCQVGPVAPAPLQQEYTKPAQNSIAENEVLPEQHPQRYYYNFYPQPQPEVNQQFIPIAKPYQTVATQIVHIPVTKQQPAQESQVAQNLIDDNKLPEQNPPLKVAYLQPTYGYGSKIYPYTFAQNIQTVPVSDQSAVVPLDGGGNNQEDLQNKNNNHQANQIQLLKNNQEFQELSALIGKSPMDQVHGLSYLLAKEMQRQKISNNQRPQDQTSPILFHPKESTSVTSTSQLVQQQNFENPKVENNQVLPFQPLRPLHTNAPRATAVQQHNIQPHATKSEVSLRDGKAIGLSPNYNGIDSQNNNFSPKKIYPQSEGENDGSMEYASKYAFGYRVRDFKSGNDYSHKQNRDADGVTRGQYHILMPDGRIQNVIYYADDTGFHADIL